MLPQPFQYYITTDDVMRKWLTWGKSCKSGVPRIVCKNVQAMFFLDMNFNALLLDVCGKLCYLRVKFFIYICPQLFGLFSGDRTFFNGLGCTGFQ